MRGSIRLPAVVVAGLLLVLAASLVLAEAPANEHFQRTWARTDQGVANGSVARTWIWGPEGNTGALQEAYADTPGGLRTVQYFDKARMEINNPAGDPSSPFYVTNGLLVVELMTGQLQRGNISFEPHAPASVNVAGDANDPGSPTYAELAPLRSAPAVGDGSFITQRVDGNGVVSNDPSLAGQNVTAAFRLSVPGIEHQVASPFWEFLNSTSPVIVNGQAVTERLFDPWFYATGYPITEAYWADVKVAGTVRLVLMQCFERRCLTYTPGNPAGFLTEAGNVGQHYYTWRYEQINGGPVEPLTNYEYVTDWGGFYTPIEPFTVARVVPWGVAVNAQDNLWVADGNNHRLLEFNERGIHLGHMGTMGSGEAQFNIPYDADFSDDGRMFVADFSNNRVQVFDAQGFYLTQWGTPDTGTSQGLYPKAIAVQGNRVYVANNLYHRVHVYDLEGVDQGAFGVQGSVNGQFEFPSGLAIDAQGNVYVADYLNARVQKFSSTGVYISTIGSVGTGDGQFMRAISVAISGDGSIYVVDDNLGRVQKFDQNGVFVTKWGSLGAGHGQFNDPTAVAVDSEGNVYVGDRGNHRVQKFTSDGVFLYQVSDSLRGRFAVPTDITVDQNGNLLVADPFLDTQMIARYTPDGDPLDDYRLKMSGAGPSDAPYAVAVNAQGDIYVLDSAADHVKRFSSTWEYQGQFGTGGTGQAQFNTAHDIAIDADGNVYVADSLNDRVQKFDANGVFLDEWGSAGDGDGQFVNAWSIAIDGERVYVTDLGNHRVQVFNRDGDYLGQWGSFGTEPGQLDAPTGIGVNPDGYVLVVDNGNNRVQVFTPEGEFVDVFGSAGADPGQFIGPLAVVVDADGYAYVTESGNSRVQKFAPVP